VSSAEPYRQAAGDDPGPPSLAGVDDAPAPSPSLAAADGCAPEDPAGNGDIRWAWPQDAASLPADAPLQALMLSATKLMGAYGQNSVRAAGLKVSLAGLGVLRILMGQDGLKASDVADRAWSSPGTLTSVVNTLVRDGFVERRADGADRRVVRLYITDAGRALITCYVSQAAAWWRNAFDFVSSEDEAVVRRFFVQMIDHLSKLTAQERGA
jgi:DNA-binding MarR family transcriptional regulator